MGIVFVSLKKNLREERDLNYTIIVKKRGFSLFGKELRWEECHTVFWKAQNISFVSCFFYTISLPSDIFPFSIVPIVIVYIG